MHESWEEYQLEKQARIIDAILPATDREWGAQLDQVAPVVTETYSIRFILNDFPEGNLNAETQ